MPSSAQFLLSHFDRLAEAPGGIAKLRALIVQLAMQGKLVSQSKTDEPASALLERIRAEKKRLVAKGSISKEKPLPEIEAEEAPFDIPATWAWSRLGDALEYSAGENASPEELPLTGWLLELEDIEKDSSRLINEAVVSDRNPTSHKTKFLTGDVLYGKLRPYLNKVIVAHRAGYCTTEIIALRPLCDVDPQFIKWALKRPDFLDYVARVGYGTKMPRLGTDDGRLAFLPLPPLAEQRRIVAKLEELMNLCDALEAVQREREAVRSRLRTSALHQLVSPDPESKTATFVLQNLSRLVNVPDDLEDLRHFIRQLAVQGQLLLQLKSERHVLDKSLCDADPDLPIAPETWRWATVGEVGDHRLGKMLDHQKNLGTPKRYLRNINVRWFDFDLSNVLEMKFEDKELEEFSLKRGDVMICEGGYPGRAAVWDEREPNIYFQKAIHRVRFSKAVDPHFFALRIRTDYDSGHLAGYFTGTGIQHFTGRGLASYKIPLPPLAEQRRIVAKVDELMAVLDALEATLTTARTTAANLLSALVGELTIN